MLAPSEHPKNESSFNFFTVIAIMAIVLPFTALNLVGFYEILILRGEVEELRNLLNSTSVFLPEDYADDYLEDDPELDGESDQYEENNFLTKEMKFKQLNRNKRDVIADSKVGVTIRSDLINDKIKQDRSGSNINKISNAPVDPAYHSPPWLFGHEKPPTNQNVYPPTSAGPKKQTSTKKSRVMRSEDESQAAKQVANRLSVRSLKKPHGEGEEIIFNRPHKSHRIKAKNFSRMETMDEVTSVGVTTLKPNRKVHAAHFNGDSSKYVYGQHTNFKGNGHLQHLDPTYVDWVASEWVSQLNMNSYFLLENGGVQVTESGLYFIYAQIYYLDEHDTNGYRVYKNGDPILQCTTMTHSSENITKGNTCYTAGVEYLAEDDKVTIRDIIGKRYSLFEKGKSFFGLFKLADARIK